ncbi:unnamed protein product [Prunus armeniaca]|uniref:Uncharacterized protein n=1 Tax=Prunus armeniaca TaxID=36596 RepID=A0A6J5UQZ2_PRUAR|nr:unnamed protein product [Prunus armeniaca]CAB4308786.1 unnamed protein product [Prunus armeniaca]
MVLAGTLGLGRLDLEGRETKRGCFNGGLKGVDRCADGAAWNRGDAGVIWVVKVGCGVGAMAVLEGNGGGDCD